MKLILAAQPNFHDIAPPVNYSFVPAWVIFVGTFFGLCLIGLLIWLWKRKPKTQLPPKTPRQIALEELETISREIETTAAYQFSIRVSTSCVATSQINLACRSLAKLQSNFLPLFQKLPRFQ